MKRSAPSAAIADNSYFDLVRRFPLRPINNEDELKAATAVMNELVDRGFDSLTAGEADYLDVLSDVVKKYEDQHHAIPDASPVEVLKFLIDDRQTNQRAVAHGSGIAVSTISEILAGHRQMNLEHMQKLATFFKVDVGAFLQRDHRAASEAVELQAAGMPVSGRGQRAATRRVTARRHALIRKK